MNRPLVLFDLDDTLIDTSPVYEAAIVSLIARLQVILPGPPTQSALRVLQEEIDADWSQGVDFDRTRFPRSFAETYRRAARAAGVEPDDAEATRCAELGEVVLTSRPALLPDALTLLDAIGKRAEVELYTLGVPEVQMPKIHAHGLEALLSRIHVVPRKDVATLERIVNGRTRSRTAIVGDSLRFEINPALELNLFAVHVRRPHLWKYAQVPATSSNYHEVQNLAQARQVLENQFLDA